MVQYIFQKIDLEFISFLGRNGVPLTIVFTKIDKQSQRDTVRNISAFKQAMSEIWDELPTMIMTSSVTGYGRDNLLDYIDSINNSLNMEI